MTRSLDITRLGTADPGTQLSAAGTVDGEFYVGTRSSHPVTLARFDPETERVDAVHEAESWDTAAHDRAYIGTRTGLRGITGDEASGTVYAGMNRTGEIWRPAIDDVESFVDVPGPWTVWDLSVAPDGVVYAATYPGAGVYAYDPRTGHVDDLGPADPDEEYARSVHATTETVYVGCGTKEAHLVAIDRDTGERVDLLPERLADRSMVDGIRTVGERVVASVRGRGSDVAAALVFADRAAPHRTDVVALDGVSRVYAIAAVDETGTTDLPAATGQVDDGPTTAGTGDRTIDGAVVYAVARRRLDDGVSTVVLRYDVAAGSLTQQAQFPGTVGCVHGGELVVEGDGRLLFADDYGAVQRVDLASGERDAIDLVDAGLTPREELPQSMTVADGRVYVAGHRKLHEHRSTGGPTSEPVRTVRLPGEAKAMTVVDDTLYAAVYSGAYLCAWDLGGSDDPTVVAAIGKEQNRTRSICHHVESGLLLVGTVPDSGRIGGAVSAYDPATGTLTVDRGVVPGQSIRRVTPDGDAAYLASERRGGGGSDPGETEARLVRWDPVAREQLWETTPVSGAETIMDVVVHEEVPYGITGSGTLFAVDPDTRETRFRKQIVPEEYPGTLAVVDGTIYGATDRRVYAFDPDTRTASTVIDGLSSYWYNEPMLAADDAIFLVDDFDLLRIDP